MRGLFFSFDGVDGCGKSTQIEHFLEWLRGLGHSVVACRDPGGTALGESVRQILLHEKQVPLDIRSEMLLYMASRAQLVAEVIRPALAAGRIVVSDRYLLANVVYQGHAAELDPLELWEVGRVATAGLEPRQTFLLDLDVAVAATRLGDQLDRMESRGQSFQQRVREGFLVEAAAHSQRIAVVDASRSIGEIQNEIRRLATPLLPQRDDAAASDVSLS